MSAWRLLWNFIMGLGLSPRLHLPLLPPGTRTPTPSQTQPSPTPTSASYSSDCLLLCMWLLLFFLRGVQRQHFSEGFRFLGWVGLSWLYVLYTNTDRLAHGLGWYGMGLGWWWLLGLWHFSCVGRWFLGNPFVHMITQRVQHETQPAERRRRSSHLLTVENWSFQPDRHSKMRMGVCGSPVKLGDLPSISKRLCAMNEIR